MRRKARYFWFFPIILIVFAGLALPAAAQAAGGQTSGGLWASLFYALQTAQKNFDAEITALMAAFRQNSSAGWWLIGISFLYGILHAAGPGHGKAVISSYLVANNETLKRGIILAFWSSLLQAATAIILVGLIFAVFTGKQAQQAATRNLEIIGAALIMLLGLRLLIRNSLALLKNRPAHAHSYAHMPVNAALRQKGKVSQCGCGGHSAAPGSAQPADWRQQAALVFSVGIRPCTGALVVMGFALMNGLFALGAAAVLAMSFGTFLIVSVLAYIAVNAKKLALRLSRGDAGKARAQKALEWAAALFIFLSGLALLLAAFY